MVKFHQLLTLSALHTIVVSYYCFMFLFMTVGTLKSESKQFVMIELKHCLGQPPDCDNCIFLIFLRKSGLIFHENCLKQFR